MAGIASNNLTEGQTVGAGRFTLVRQIGRGGMGVVWLARDERFKEEVALKFLPPGIAADAAALHDLHRETQKSRRLTHTHIVRIHDLYEAPNEPAFIAMEYVDGSNLAILRLRQPKCCLTWDFLRPLVIQLCQALDYAHGEKVVHRDLKPSNLMLDARGRLKLADFGIAATISDSVSRVSAPTDTSGTALYMSPQQIRGELPRPTDDIYALGATLYELLAGKPPFYLGGAVAVMHQVLNEPVPPLTKRLAQFEITHPIPAEVTEFIMACLAKDVAQRPQTAQAVIALLDVPATQTSSVMSAKSPPAPKTPPDAKADGAPASGPARFDDSPQNAGPEAGAPAAVSGTLDRRRKKLAWAAVLALLLVGIAGYWLKPPAGKKAKDSIAGAISNVGQAIPAKPTAPANVPSAAPAPGEPKSELPARPPAPTPPDAPALAELIINVVPAGAELLTNGASLGHPTYPFLLKGQAGQTLQVIARLQGYATVAKFISYPETGQFTNETITLQPKHIFQAQAKRWTNSLSQIFVPVPGTGVFFCVWDTRVKDYAQYAAANPGVDGSWLNPEYLGVEVTPFEDCPVVSVNWDDAQAFCRWLTEQERGKGLLTETQSYRLPRDAEWSVAAGLNEPGAGSPGDKSGNIKDVYPWDAGWPPPDRTANYADVTAKLRFNNFNLIPGYDDGYATTSPVGAFKPNRFGLYDIGGNVWQWCEDWYDGEQKYRVLRGASWIDHDPVLLLSSLRYDFVPRRRNFSIGFRVVLVTGGSSP